MSNLRCEICQDARANVTLGCSHKICAECIRSWVVVQRKEYRKYIATPRSRRFGPAPVRRANCPFCRCTITGVTVDRNVQKNQENETTSEANENDDDGDDDDNDDNDDTDEEVVIVGEVFPVTQMSSSLITEQEARLDAPQEQVAQANDDETPQANNDDAPQANNDDAPQPEEEQEQEQVAQPAAQSGTENESTLPERAEAKIVATNGGSGSSARYKIKHPDGKTEWVRKAYLEAEFSEAWREWFRFTRNRNQRAYTERKREETR